MQANDAGAEAGRRLPAAQPDGNKRNSGRFHGNQFTRRSFLNAIAGAETYRQAVRLTGLGASVAFRELQMFVREKRER